MGTPRIVYAGRTIDLGYLTSYVPSPSLAVAIARADSGAARRIITGAYDHVQFDIEAFADRRLYLALRSWWDYAATGAPWSFAVDSAKASATTLSVAAEAGSDTLSLVSGGGAGFQPRDEIRIIDAVDPTVREISYVTGIVADAIYCTELRNAFSAGSVVRHLQYHPALEILSETCPVQENDGLSYSLSVEAREALP